MDNVKRNIGFKIKKLRESVSLSQEIMAKELSVPQSVLSKIENGFVEKIDCVLMDKICKLFKVDLSYFLDDSFSQTNHDNKNTAISIFGNPTVNNNHYPESILAEVQRLIDENKQLRARIAEMESKNG